MTTIPTTRSIEHGLPYNAASTRSSLTMVTTLTILGKSNWTETEIYPMLWMWWRTQQTYATTMTQMTTVTMTTLMRKKIPKTKRIPTLPIHKWEDGGYGQRLSHGCRNRNRCFFCLFVVVVCRSFPQTLAKVCGCFGVWVLFLGIFLSIGVCVFSVFSVFSVLSVCVLSVCA